MLDIIVNGKLHGRQLFLIFSSAVVVAMLHGRRDHSKHAIICRATLWTAVVQALLYRRRRAGRERRSHRLSSVLLEAVKPASYRFKEKRLYFSRVRHIQHHSWVYLLNVWTDLQWQECFRINKQDLPVFVSVVAWPAYRSSTTRNNYSTCPTLSTLILLRRLASPCRWSDLTYVFYKHPAQLSEIFWETLKRFWAVHKQTLTGPLSATFFEQRAHTYAAAVRRKCAVMDRCLGFIDGTVLGIARPVDYDVQHAAYNGHKRKHALKFQTLTTPDGLVMHAHGPMAGSRHDWALYVASDMDEQLQEVCYVNGVQYYFHGDTGYNRRHYLDVPFAGGNLSPAQRAANKSTGAARVTVEWMYKEIKLYWTTSDFKRKLRAGESPVGLLYLTSMFLMNVRTCYYRENTVSQYFNCSPPSLQEYLQHKY